MDNQNPVPVNAGTTVALASQEAAARMMTWQVYQPPQGLADLISGGMVHSALLAHTAAWGSTPAVLNVTIESHGKTYLTLLIWLACFYLHVKSMVWLGQRHIAFGQRCFGPP